MVAVTGLIKQILYIFISLCLFLVFFWDSGAIFGAARTSLLLKENHYSIGIFKEKSFVRNYVSYSLHLTLAMITYSHCRKQTNSEICSANETQMSSWCQKLAVMLPEGCVFYKDKIVFHLKFKSSAMM